MGIWIFCRLGLKCLFTLQKYQFLEVWTSKRHWSSSRPQKAHPWLELHWHADFGGDRSSGATWARAEGIKKARLETYSGKLGVCPDHTHWRVDMWCCVLGGLWEIVLSFKFHQNRLNSFRDVGGRIFPFPITLASGLCNSLYYHTRRDKVLVMSTVNIVS